MVALKVVLRWSPHKFNVHTHTPSLRVQMCHSRVRKCHARVWTCHASVWTCEGLGVVRYPQYIVQMCEAYVNVSTSHAKNPAYESVVPTHCTLLQSCYPAVPCRTRGGRVSVITKSENKTRYDLVPRCTSWKVASRQTLKWL